MAALVPASVLIQSLRSRSAAADTEEMPKRVSSGQAGFAQVGRCGQLDLIIRRSPSVASRWGGSRGSAAVSCRTWEPAGRPRSSLVTAERLRPYPYFLNRVLRSPSGTVRGPGGDHTACVMVAGMPSTTRPDLGGSVRDVGGRVANRPGGQGLVGSNPAVPTGKKP